MNNLGSIWLKNILAFEQLAAACGTLSLVEMWTLGPKLLAQTLKNAPKK